jgi:hypothetical protein|tara:strand:- start:372 stop:584 length:213 start_codon:yes stop_codon:yes gene_type:complete
MDEKKKVIDICNNLTRTINTISSKEHIRSEFEWANSKASRADLVKKRRVLMARHKLEPKDIKDYGRSNTR